MGFIHCFKRMLKWEQTVRCFLVGRRLAQRVRAAGAQVPRATLEPTPSGQSDHCSGENSPLSHSNFLARFLSFSPLLQFNFVSFDDLIPYLPKFRQTFPNVDNFEFLETDIRTLNQLNALSLVQGITSLFIGDDGNPIYHKGGREGGG